LKRHGWVLPEHGLKCSGGGPACQRIARWAEGRQQAGSQWYAARNTSVRLESGQTLYQHGRSAEHQQHADEARNLQRRQPAMEPVADEEPGQDQRQG